MVSVVVAALELWRAMLLLQEQEEQEEEQEVLLEQALAQASHGPVEQRHWQQLLEPQTLQRRVQLLPLVVAQPPPQVVPLSHF